MKCPALNMQMCEAVGFSALSQETLVFKIHPLCAGVGTKVCTPWHTHRSQKTAFLLAGDTVTAQDMQPAVWSCEPLASLLFSFSISWWSRPVIIGMCE